VLITHTHTQILKKKVHHTISTKLKQELSYRKTDRASAAHTISRGHL